MLRAFLLSAFALAGLVTAEHIAVGHSKLDKRGSVVFNSQPAGSTITTCETYTWSYSASPAPYAIFLYDATTRQLTRTLALGYTGSSISWQADVPAGSQLFLNFFTSDGTVTNSGPWTVYDDPNAATCDSTGARSLTCKTGHKLIIGSGTCTTDNFCPPGTSDDGFFGCFNCGENVATCTKAGPLTCLDDYVLYLQRCQFKFCPSGLTNSDGRCLSCADPYAETCTAEMTITCLPGHKLVQSTSTCTTTDACPSATYDDGNGSCVACSSNAAECTSSGATACAGSYVLYDQMCASTTCPSGFFNNGGICTRCADPYAATCTSTKTLACQSGHLLVASTGRCTTSSDWSCPATTYKDGSSCKPCTMTGAYTCTATAATSCYQPPNSPKTYLSSGRCLSATQCQLSKLLAFAWLKSTTQPDGTATYECARCPGLGIVNLLNPSRCLL
ncbi:hypothetical protein JCM8097_002692 [Rhodosporidiobolus ruineniae]